MARVRKAANDRAPTLAEIQRLIEYPDRRIKPIVYTMLSYNTNIGDTFLLSIISCNLQLPFYTGLTISTQEFVNSVGVKTGQLIDMVIVAQMATF
jgi:hypothetical protein